MEFSLEKEGHTHSKKENDAITPIPSKMEVSKVYTSIKGEMEHVLDTQKETETETESDTKHPSSLHGFELYKDKGLTGLSNLGNTCFMNTTLQCLSHCYEFNNFLNTKTYEKKVNKTCDTVILLEWDKLRQLMWSENCVISPGGFLSNVHKIATMKDRQIFTGFAQNDLPEFLYFLVETFHNAIKRKVNMVIHGKKKDTTDELAEKCYMMMRDMYKTEYSEILNLFYGIHVSQIYKEEPHEIVSQTPEPFFLIHLPVPEKTSSLSSCSLYDCFDLYTKSEKMDGENMWYNEKTEQKEEVHKNILFFKLPDVLIMDLKRFDNRMRKNNLLVDIPLEKLDLSKYVVGYNKEEYVYDLFGICNHSGSTMGGHYTATVRNANAKWYEFNDTRITEIQDEKRVITPRAYCLFYRKRKM